jgi:hypothetical protein
MEIQGLKTGAAVNRRTAKKSPLEILYSLKENDPTASTDRLFLKWKKLVEGDTDLSDAVMLYAFTNFNSQIDTFLNGRKKQRLTNHPTLNERRERIATMAKQVKKIIYLDMVMPNEKPMKACTFKEVGTFGDSFKLIATQGKPSQLVGDVLTNADVQKLFLGGKK